MKKRIIKISLIFMIILIGLMIPKYVKATENSEIVEITVTGACDYDYARQVYNLVNAEREKNGLEPLEYDKELCEAAMIRAAELPSNFSHTRPNGEAWFSINQNVNGENIAIGYEVPNSVMNGWMNSQGHKKNILGAYKSMGVGVYCEYGTRNMYWVQLFSYKSATEILEIDKTDYEWVTQKIQVSKEYAYLRQLVAEGLKEENTIKIGETISSGNIYIGALNTSEINGEEKVGSCFRVISPTDIIWKSSDINVFTVDEQGNITGVGEGTGTITLSFLDVTLSLKITVEDVIPDGTTMSLDKKTYQLNSIGDTVILKANLSIGREINAEWSTSNSKVATVDENGIVTAVNGGFVYITAKTSYGDDNCWVYVRKLRTLSDGKKVYPGDVNADGKINAGDASLILSMAKKENLTEDEIAVCDLDSNGIIDNADSNLAIEIFKMEYFKPGKYSPITNISINKTNLTLDKGSTFLITATYEPQNTTSSPKLIWTSSNEKIVTVDNNGKITAINSGTATITVKTSNNKIATCEVTVPGLVYTTIPTKEILEKDVMEFNSKTVFTSIVTSENFPILDVDYKVELYSASNIIKENNDKVGSKNIIKIKDIEGNVVAEYTVIVKGDINGDGKVTMYDAFTILKETLFENSSLDEIENLVRDFNDDGKVTMYDAFQFLKQAIL